MKKLLVSVMSLIIGATMIASAADVVNVTVDYSEKSVTADGKLEGREKGFLLGMTVYDTENNLINISDTKTDHAGRFSFDKILFGEDAGFEILTLNIDTGDEIVEKSTVMIFEDEEGSGKISNFVSEISKLSDAQLAEYYMDFLEFAGFDTNAYKCFDKIVSGGNISTLTTKLKSDAASADTKDKYVAMVKNHILSAAVKHLGIMDLNEALFTDFEINKSASFKANEYKRLNSYRKESVLNSISGEDFDDKAAVISALNSAIAAETAAANKGNGSGSGGGSSSGGGSYKASTSLVTPPNTNISSDKVQTALFADTVGHWGKAEIEELASKKIVNGYPDDTFRPDNTVTRAEAASIIKKAFGFESAEKNNEFTDVKSSDWYYDYINTLYEAGILKGSDGKIYPNEYLTREDMCVLISRCTNLSSAETQVTYSDGEDIADYAKDAVNIMSGNGIVQGSDGMFRPKNHITRGELCAIVSRTLKRVK